MKTFFWAIMSISLVMLISCSNCKNNDKSFAAIQAITENIDEQNLNNINKKNQGLLVRRGCCSHHGGVYGCDQASGMMRCNDGTLSPTCTCADY